jgi:hypothetical protein
MSGTIRRRKLLANHASGHPDLRSARTPDQGALCGTISVPVRPLRFNARADERASGCDHGAWLIPLRWSAIGDVVKPC